MDVSNLLSVYTDDDKSHLYAAYDYAYRNSTDPSTMNGAVLISGVSRLAYGTNHFPKSVANTPERWERPLKYSFVEHAERNAIYSAAKNGICTDMLTMYCPWFACDSCARGIVQSGIKQVVGLKKPFDLTPEHWVDSVDLGLSILSEGGVIMRVIDAHLGINILFNGEMVVM